MKKLTLPRDSVSPKPTGIVSLGDPICLMYPYSGHTVGPVWVQGHSTHSWGALLLRTGALGSVGRTDTPTAETVHGASSWEGRALQHPAQGGHPAWESGKGLRGMFQRSFSIFPSEISFHTALTR